LIILSFPWSHFVSQLGKDEKIVIQILYRSLLCVLLLIDRITMPQLRTVVQLFEALCYKSEGHWFDSQWCHWNFSWT
jgi:hypothetical protein